MNTSANLSAIASANAIASASANMNGNGNAALFEYFLGLLGQIKLYHWATMSYVIHKALDELHSSLSSSTDKLIEVYMGKYQKQPLELFSINMTANTDTSNMIEFLKTCREQIRSIRNKHFKTCSEIQNIMDDMLSSIHQTIYLCNLK